MKKYFHFENKNKNITVPLLFFYANKPGDIYHS